MGGFTAYTGHFAVLHSDHPQKKARKTPRTWPQMGHSYALEC